MKRKIRLSVSFLVLALLNICLVCIEEEDNLHTFLLENFQESRTEQMEKERYPKHVFFIVAHEFFERYAYYGIRSVLVIYLVSTD